MPGRKPDPRCEMMHESVPAPLAVEHIRVRNFNPYAEGMDLSSEYGRVEGSWEIYEINVCQDHANSRRTTARSRSARGKLKIEGLGVPRRREDSDA